MCFLWQTERKCQQLSNVNLKHTLLERGIIIILCVFISFFHIFSSLLSIQGTALTGSWILNVVSLTLACLDFLSMSDLVSNRFMCSFLSMLRTRKIKLSRKFYFHLVPSGVLCHMEHVVRGKLRAFFGEMYKKISGVQMTVNCVNS